MDSALEPAPLDVLELLRVHQIRLKKSLGQNFLIDAGYLDRIISAAEVTPNSSVLEIGAGLGGLTCRLAQAARRVVAVELDDRLAEILRQAIAPWQNVTVVQGDILQMPAGELMGESGYLVVANIPYYITSALIRRLLEAPCKPARLTLTIQQEVAGRICAAPGRYSLLALSVQVYGQPRPALRIPAGAFYPPPKVDSATLRIDLYPSPLIPYAQLDAFFRLAKAGFGQKRKTLRNALAAGLGRPADEIQALLEKAQIAPQRRAETLSIAEWRHLTEQFYKQQP